MFGCNGQHSGASTRVAGGTMRLEISGLRSLCYFWKAAVACVFLAKHFY